MTATNVVDRCCICCHSNNNSSSFDLVSVTVLCSTEWYTRFWYNGRLTGFHGKIESQTSLATTKIRMLTKNKMDGEVQHLDGAICRCSAACRRQQPASDSASAAAAERRDVYTNPTTRLSPVKQHITLHPQSVVFSNALHISTAKHVGRATNNMLTISLSVFV